MIKQVQQTAASNGFTAPRHVTKYGFTLLEVVIAISVSSAIMLMSVYTLHQAFGLAARMKRASDEIRRVAALASLFREDVSQSRSIQLVSESLLDLQVDDSRRIQYRIDDKNTIHRELNANGSESREAFKLSPVTSAKIVFHDSKSTVELQIFGQTSSKEQSVVLEQRIQATTRPSLLGGDHD